MVSLPSSAPPLQPCQQIQIMVKYTDKLLISYGLPPTRFPMDIQSAIHLIEENPNYEEFAAIRRVFTDRLAELKETDFTERGICYYYLLRIVLRSHLMYVTEECQDYFSKMNEEFEKQRIKYKKDGKKFSRSEINDFFHLLERSYGSLEVIFRHKNFVDEMKHAYERKMKARKNHFWYQNKFLRWLEYEFLELTSNYGESFVRWGLTSVIFALVMGLLFYVVDISYPHPIDQMIVPPDEHWYNYLYFSIATLTSLGFGDYLPHNFWGKLFSSIEVFFGFTMLGIFISLIQKRM